MERHLPFLRIIYAPIAFAWSDVMWSVFASATERSAPHLFPAGDFLFQCHTHHCYHCNRNRTKRHCDACDTCACLRHLRLRCSAVRLQSKPEGKEKYTVAEVGLAPHTSSSLHLLTRLHLRYVIFCCCYRSSCDCQNQSSKSIKRKKVTELFVGRKSMLLFERRQVGEEHVALVVVVVSQSLFVCSSRIHDNSLSKGETETN